jgi:hypothetical protein
MVSLDEGQVNTVSGRALAAMIQSLARNGFQAVAPLKLEIICQGDRTNDAVNES